MATPYYKKEVIKVPDTVGLVMSLFEDDLLNHRLKHVIKKFNFQEEDLRHWQDFPGLKVESVDFLSIVVNEPISDDEIGLVWIEEIMVTVAAHERSKIYYPPAELVGEIEENRYDELPKLLRCLHWIVFNIISENRKYKDPNDSTFGWDFVEPSLTDYIPTGYLGANDVGAIEQSFRFRFEVKTRGE